MPRENTQELIKKLEACRLGESVKFTTEQKEALMAALEELAKTDEAVAALLA
jgi:hypothetical protein